MSLAKARSSSFALTLASVTAISSLSSPSAKAELLFGVTVPGPSGTSLISFDSANPAGFTTVGGITGLLAGHSLRGIDFRPANGQLYAISTDAAAATVAQLYTIDLVTAVASPVGAGIALTGSTSTRVSIDFNPVVDRIRVVTGSAQSFRVNPDTGAVVAQDTDISGTPLISGIAYSDNVPGATQTTLYAYDFLQDNLGTIGGINGVPSPNAGAFSIIGSSGVVTGDAGLGFDISGATGVGYVSGDDFNGSAGAAAEFFTIDLGTGVVTQVGPDDVFAVLDISVQPVPAPGTFGLLAATGVVALRRRRA